MLRFPFACTYKHTHLDTWTHGHWRARPHTHAHTHTQVPPAVKQSLPLQGLETPSIFAMQKRSWRTQWRESGIPAASRDGEGPMTLSTISNMPPLFSALCTSSLSCSSLSSLLPVQMQRESSLIDLVVSTKGYLGDTVLLLSVPQMPSQEAGAVSNGWCVLREILRRHAAMQNRSVPLCLRDSTTTHDTFSLDFFFFST